MRPLAVILSAALVAAVLADLTPAQDSRPASKPDSRTTGRPALALARRVHDYAGGAEGLRQVKNIVFTFSVRGSRRRQFWDLSASKVRVEFPKVKARSLGVPIHVLVFDIRQDENVLRYPPRPHPNAPRVSAKSIWINDSYWLLAPLKVLDPGVQLSIDPRQDDDPAGIARLRLRFQAGTGLTPKNEYVLHVEQDTGRVTRWDFYRTAKARPRSWRFEDYRRIGSLRLSLDRPPIGERNGIHVGFSDVQVNPKAPARVWTSTERLFLQDEEDK
jgi:hypothetical protein